MLQILSLAGLSLISAARVTDGLVYDLKFDDAQSVITGPLPDTVLDSAGANTLGDVSLATGATFLEKEQGIELDGTNSAGLPTPNNLDSLFAVSPPDFTFEIWVDDASTDLTFPKILLGNGDTLTTSQGDTTVCNAGRQFSFATASDGSNLAYWAGAVNKGICHEVRREFAQTESSLTVIFITPNILSHRVWGASSFPGSFLFPFSATDDNDPAEIAFDTSSPLTIAYGGWSGKIKRLAIYDRGLLPAEREANYAAGLPNSRPHATAFTATVAEDTRECILLTLSGATSVSDAIYDFDYDPNDAERNTLEVTILAAPSHGTLYRDTVEITDYPAVVDITTFDLCYMGDLNYYNDNDLPDDTFQFKVNDGEYDSETATVSVVVTNVDDLPIPTDQDLEVIGSQLTITLGGTETDQLASDGLYIRTLPAAGVLKLMDGTTILDGDLPKSITPYNADTLSAQVVYELPSVGDFTSGADVIANYDFTFYFTNAGDESADGQVNLEIKNPLQAGTVTAGINEDSPALVQFAGSDARNDTADWTVILTELPNPSFVVFSKPDGSPATLNTDTGSQSLVATPALDWSGSVTFRYSIQNDGITSADLGTGTLTVVAVNDAPVVTINVRNTTIAFRGLSRYSLSITDVDGPVGGSGLAGYTVILNTSTDAAWLANETGRLAYSYPPEADRTGVVPQDQEDWAGIPADSKISPPLFFQADDLDELNAAVQNLTVSWGSAGKIYMYITVIDTLKDKSTFRYNAASHRVNEQVLLTLEGEDEFNIGENELSELSLIIIYAASGAAFLACLLLGLCLAYRKWMLSKDVLAAHSGDDQYEDRL